MRNKKTIRFAVAVLLGLLLFLCSCGTKKELDEELDDGTSGFSFEFTYWSFPERKNIWSTEEKRIQKDLISQGVASENWVISKKDLEEVKVLVKEYHVTQMEEELKQYEEMQETIWASPMNTEFTFSFTLDGQRYTVANTFALLDGIPKENPLHEYATFIEKLFEILERQAVYKALPEPSEAYN